MQSPNRALMWAFMLGAATLVLSPVGLLSGAVIALVTLAAGLQPGIRVLLATLLGWFFRLSTRFGQRIAVK